MAPGGLWRRIRVNPLFVLALGLYVLAGYERQMVIAFIAVTLHELSHAVVAELYGLYVERVEIWPFGGIARIQGLDSEDPYVETTVAVAGPLLNFFWAALVWAFDRVLPFNPAYLDLFVETNLAIGALNLLPVAPLDGGRLARAYLARQIGYDEAERRVREGGLWLARLLLALTVVESLVGRVNLALGVFAAFLYWGALKVPKHAPYWAVRDLAQRFFGFERRPVWPVDDFAARAETRIGDVIRVMRPLKYHRVVVLDSHLKRLGVLYEEALYRALAQKGPECKLGDLLDES
ncbi:MAG: site-2 protease family protein [Firmicutes bacterium]|nr:site-2 protease family protein [Bacillota bacterium]